MAWVLQGSFWQQRPVFACPPLAPQPLAQKPLAQQPLALQPSSYPSGGPTFLAPHVAAALGRPPAGPPPSRPPAGAVPSPPAQQHRNAVLLPFALPLAAPGAGRSLEPGLRGRLEDFFGADFAPVKIHVGLQAKAVGARAFSLGGAVYFAPGLFDPVTPHGQRLLVHELTHVLQQRAGRVQNPFRQGIAVVQDPALEAEAENAGLRFLRHVGGARIGPGGATRQPNAVQCKESRFQERPAAATPQVVQPSKKAVPKVQEKDEEKEKPPAKKKKAPKRPFELTKSTKMDPVSGHSGSGYLPEKTKLEVRKPRKYHGKVHRQEQVLGQLSSQIYFSMKVTQHENPVEIEGMFAGGSLFLSANGAAATQNLYNFLLLTKSDELWKHLRKSYGRGKDKKISARHGQKLGELQDEKRKIPEAKEVVDTLKGQVGWLDLSDKDIEFYASGALSVGGMTFVVFGQNGRHAEVKLVKVLEAAGYKGGAVIQGKKRPCYTCACYMRLRKREGYGLTFSDHPGKLWKDEYIRSESDVRQEVIRSLNSGVKSHKTEVGEAYRSESESESESDEEIRQTKTKKKKRKLSPKKKQDNKSDDN